MSKNAWRMRQHWDASVLRKPIGFVFCDFLGISDEVAQQSLRWLCQRFSIRCFSFFFSTVCAIMVRHDRDWTVSIERKKWKSFTSSKSFSLASGNSFSILSDSSESDRSHRKSLSYPKPNAAYDRTSSMKILNINCQSIINKRSEFQSVLDLEKPDFVIGTESWLNTDHLDSEIFPRSLGYTSFRRDRASGTKGGGGYSS